MSASTPHAATPITDEARDRCSGCGLEFVPVDVAERLERGNRAPAAHVHVGPCPDGDACPDARRYGSIHPAPKERPSVIYVWLVPSEEVLDQPGNWRIRKWDTEPFPEGKAFAVSEMSTSFATTAAAGEQPPVPNAAPQGGSPDIPARTGEGSAGVAWMIEARVAWVRDLGKAGLPYPGEKGLEGFAAGWDDGFAAGCAASQGASHG